ncbi:hypothetical protein [Mycolicibacterium hippocampi]|uniref:hypothetical protein n=1 Tax=Mycolicibacterium hippocampi TaxID=659824 RepID=UPI003511B053
MGSTSPLREPSRDELVFPAVDIAEGDAEYLPDTLAIRGLSTTDVVISSLPWASFGPELQQRLIHAVTTTLSPDSVFATFSYAHAQHLPQARRFRSLLSELLTTVENPASRDG